MEIWKHGWYFDDDISWRAQGSKIPLSLFTCRLARGNGLDMKNAVFASISRNKFGRIWRNLTRTWNISTFCPIIKTLTHFQNVAPFSKCYLILKKNYQNLPIFKIWPNFKMLSHFLNFDHFQNVDKFSIFWPIFKMLTHF